MGSKITMLSKLMYDNELYQCFLLLLLLLFCRAETSQPPQASASCWGVQAHSGGISTFDIVFGTHFPYWEITLFDRLRQFKVWSGGRKAHMHVSLLVNTYQHCLQRNTEHESKREGERAYDGRSNHVNMKTSTNQSYHTPFQSHASLHHDEKMKSGQTRSVIYVYIQHSMTTFEMRKWRT